MFVTLWMDRLGYSQKHYYSELMTNFVQKHSRNILVLDFFRHALCLHFDPISMNIRELFFLWICNWKTWHLPGPQRSWPRFLWQPRLVQEIIRKQAYNYPTDVWSSLGLVCVTAGTIKKFQFQKVREGTTNSLKYQITLLLPQVSRDLLEIIPKKRQLVSFQTFSLAL